MRRFPKAVLHEFYQMHEGSPVFNVENIISSSAPRFRCSLFCPEVSVGLATFPPTTFTADARSKKESEHAASEKALSALRLLGFSMTLLPSPSTGARPPYVSRDELEYLQQRLLILSAQLEVSQIERRYRRSSQPEEVQDDVDIDEISVDEARDLLRAALLKKHDLLGQVTSIFSKKKAMLGILATVEDPAESPPKSSSKPSP
jgi:Double-stranded RNA binding motif